MGYDWLREKKTIEIIQEMYPISILPSIQKDPETHLELLQDLNEKIDNFRIHLSFLSDENLNILYEQSKVRCLDYWNKQTVLTLNQCVAFIMGIYSLDQVHSLSERKDTIHEYHKWLNTLQNNIDSRDLPSFQNEEKTVLILKKDFSEWARKNGLPLHEKFNTLTQEEGNKNTSPILNLEAKISLTHHYSVGLKVAIEVSDELGERLKTDKITIVHEAINKIIHQNYPSEKAFFTNTKIKNIATLIRPPEQAKGGPKRQQKKPVKL